jgi:hypothetical protein
MRNADCAVADLRRVVFPENSLRGQRDAVHFRIHRYVPLFVRQRTDSNSNLHGQYLTISAGRRGR